MEWEHTASHQEDKLKQPTLGVLQTCWLHNTAKPSDWPHPLLVEFHHLGAAPNLPDIKRKHTQPLQRPGTRECDIGLACFENVSEVDLQKVDGHALRLVDRHRPAQTQRQLKPAELMPAGEVLDVGGPIHDDGLAVAETDHREPLGPRPLLGQWRLLLDLPASQAPSPTRAWRRRQRLRRLQRPRAVRRDDCPCGRVGDSHRAPSLIAVRAELRLQLPSPATTSQTHRSERPPAVV
mmetsp:Transcript_78844/g.225859  ORF Transcript_78844/g.225859 Transcript_78844/m.225859 type:complete len:236 (-) Transcript_78844:206-913(-)